MQDKDKKFYVTIDGQEVEVSEQIYHEYKRSLWREHKRKERAVSTSGKAHRSPWTLCLMTAWMWQTEAAWKM